MEKVLLCYQNKKGAKYERVLKCLNTRQRDRQQTT